MAKEAKSGRGPELRAIAERRREYERFLLDDLRILEFESGKRSDVWIYINHKEGDFENIETFLERSTLQLSLMNKQMVEADKLFYATEDHSERARYYKPYYFQFDSTCPDHDGMSSLNPDVMRKIVERHMGSKETGGWFHGWLTLQEDEADISIPGSLSFPVSPYQHEKVYLNISLEDESDMEAPIEIPLPDCKSLGSPGAHDERVHRELDENKYEYLNIYEYEVEIHNVGQANLIYIKSLHSDKRILFDVGLPCSYCMPKQGTAQHTNINQKMRYVSMMKPTDVIISHWHFDHGGAAFKLDDEAMKEARWIVPDWAKVNAQWVKNLVGFLGRDSHILRVKNLSDCRMATNKLGCSEISLYKGKGRSGLNNTGLILLVRDVVLPGDCDYGFWPKAVEDAYKRCNAFIVPHHGAKTQKYISRDPSRCRGEAFVSVDEANNNYGHPCQGHLAQLGNDWNYKRTDNLTNGSSCKVKV